MNGIKTYHKKKIYIVLVVIGIGAMILIGRLTYIMVFDSERYQKYANELHERERAIKAPRGIIYDRKGKVLAGNRTVCTISVIYSQIKEPEKVIDTLHEYLNLSKEELKKKVSKVSSREKIKSNVDKATGEKIRACKLAGVMVDEDYKRFYPYDTLASKVLGFTGGDNQGIVGLEVHYDQTLMGKNGSIYTLTDAAGREVKNAAETRKEPVMGDSLITSLDVNVQTYATQTAKKIKKEKKAKQVSLIVWNPQNGEIYSLVNLPEYNLNEPFKLNRKIDTSTLSAKKKQDLVNQMWRNTVINDTYEPGSTFKIITAASALEEHVVTLNDHFVCPGFRIVEDRKIRCHKVGGHGQETFKEGVMNSCNPVFMEVGARVGVSKMYLHYRKLGLMEVTGVDVPGEANSIMHKMSNVGEVELATMSFGQSFQITALQLLRAAAATVNGGKLVTPHFGVAVVDSETGKKKQLKYKEKQGAVSAETSKTMRELLEAVVSEGTGKNAKIEGESVGGKTATSEKLPRGNGKYISSFLGFSPAKRPTVMALVLIDEPVGIYYGGTIAAPVVREVFENVLPYLKDEDNP